MTTDSSLPRNLTAPHTITTWSGEAVCISSEVTETRQDRTVVLNLCTRLASEWPGLFPFWLTRSVKEGERR